MKKLLAIYGGPHKEGSTATMLSHAIDVAKSNGWEVEIIHLYEKKISYCLGCRTCLQTKQCILSDDLSQIAKQIQACDVVALATPIYWANVPASVKNLFDRLLGVAMEETSSFPKPLLSGKRYVLYMACNTRFPFSYIFGQSRYAIRSTKEFFKTAGMKCMHTYVCTNTGKTHSVPPSLLKKIAQDWKS